MEDFQGASVRVSSPPKERGRKVRKKRKGKREREKYIFNQGMVHIVQKHTIVYRISLKEEWNARLCNREI